MTAHRATVSCPECELEEAFSKLAAARMRIENHREETGHEAVWELGQFASGVEKMGNEAGVCGIPDN
ncbi:hypothetical protein C440_15079 [Haloferax mucosum ATCC BAA-1512]|uniref:Uncharacterized protein n=1 Tax=Haloferax mucosum ATCC BAA-1512 TaxID=662479 RepID=M0I725_9EURY|nr:hypothetical protein [Haloferax mucosum]ELZ91648.1 hypothetical protein C440_15079 [Haloferax mucosum ATCC BAA-1512]